MRAILRFHLRPTAALAHLVRCRLTNLGMRRASFSAGQSPVAAGGRGKLLSVNDPEWWRGRRPSDTPPPQAPGALLVQNRTTTIDTDAIQRLESNRTEVHHVLQGRG